MRVYWRHLALFLILTAALVVPFEIVDLVITRSVHGAQTLTAHQERQVLLLGLVDLMVVIPLVSALQVQAVAILGEGSDPQLAEVIRRAAPVMPVAVAAAIIAAIGAGIGLLLFLLPGIWMLLRLYVVAQTAAIERTNWPDTLRRSFSLTRGSAWRILGMLVIIGLINLTLGNVASAVTSSAGGTLWDVVVVAVALISQSFSALLGALLYFDLRAREAVHRADFS